VEGALRADSEDGDAEFTATHRRMLSSAVTGNKPPVEHTTLKNQSALFRATNFFPEKTKYVIGLHLK